MTEEQLENKKLLDTLERFKEVIEDLKLTITSITNNYEKDPDQQYKLIKKFENKLNITNESLKKPYFARIDFVDEFNHKEICYLSKVGISDFDNNLITVDWRVPIASLYYDSNIGKTSYKAPIGIIKGELTKKRQYEIENGKLLSFKDVDTVSNDEILKPYLDVNADNRLKNIVSSIQSEQNNVIRKDISENVIVQGVAGSGKTTVALHRIAYLAYNNRDIIDKENYLVIGPNKFFINYISSVLPDLDVTDVPQLTYYEFAKRYLNENLKINQVEKIDYPLNINKYKLTKNYQEELDKFINKLDKEQSLPTNDFYIKQYKILSKNKIKEIYNNLDKDIFISIESRINKTIILLSNYIKLNKNIIIKKLFDTYATLIENKSKEEINILKKEYDSIKKEIVNNNALTYLKKYFTFKNKKVTTLYNEFLQEFNNNLEAKYNKKLEIKGFIEEDLPALLYLCYKVKEQNEYTKYRHTVIDEAQDYGYFHFYALKKILKKSTFSIFGDLAQSIYDYKSIDNWEELQINCFKDASLEYLKKSYRTTIEIMNSANKVLKYINLIEAEPVIRHGEEVKIIKSDNKVTDIIEMLNSLEKDNYESIALITSSEKESKSIKKELEKNNITISEITKDNDSYNGGLCLVTSSLAKGLEFDAVIITDASEDNYSSTDLSQMKKLYVSMTRPLHKLIILYTNDLTKPLR